LTVVKSRFEPAEHEEGIDKRQEGAYADSRSTTKEHLMDMIYPNRTGFVFHVLDDNGRSGYARWVGNGQAGVAWDGGEFETESTSRT
jgi:hypothetical protein